MENEIRLQELKNEIELVNQAISLKEQDDPTINYNEFCEYMKPEWDALGKLDREQRMLMIPEFDVLPDYGKLDFDVLPDYGDIMSLKNWLECVADGGFIDYDGHGYYVKNGKESNIMLHPSDVRYDSIRDDFDTMIWYNR